MLFAEAQVIVELEVGEHKLETRELEIGYSKSNW